MKILTSSNYYPEHPGGIEFVAKNLVGCWRKNHIVRWTASDLSNYPHHSAADDVPIPAINFFENRLGIPYPIPRPGFIKRIFDEVRKCDVVHLHDCLYAMNLIIFFAAQWYRKPVTLTQHIGLVDYKNFCKEVLQKIAYATIGRWVLENADQVIFISERVKKFFEGRFDFKHPTALIPNGVDKRLFYMSPHDEREEYRSELNLEGNHPRLIFVGRFTQKKGLHLIREIAMLRPKWQWWVIGSGVIDPNTWQLENVQVISTLPQNKLRQYYSSADLFILPSTGEGFPLAAQEALACGLPVAISTETASNLTNAPVIELDISDPLSIIGAIENLLTHPEELLKMRAAAAAYALRWDWDNVAIQYENIFYSLNHQPIE